MLEITERTAIKDYPRFQEYLKAFRERGFRFAVDDAGSGYAGLGSIANLAPDYIIPSPFDREVVPVVAEAPRRADAMMAPVTTSLEFGLTIRSFIRRFLSRAPRRHGDVCPDASRGAARHRTHD